METQSGFDRAWAASNTYFGAYDPTTLVIGTAAATLVTHVAWRALRRYDFADLPASYKSLLYRLARGIPQVNREIDKEFFKIAVDIENDIQKHRKETPTRLVLPQTGLPDDEILAEIAPDAARAQALWEKGTLSGTVYGGSDTLDELITKTYRLTHRHNPLHFGEFPNVSKLEAEVVSMVGNLFGGDQEVRGLVTSGGTDSIMEAMRCYRNKAREEYGVTDPVMIVPITAHAAFRKGAEDYGIRLVSCPVDGATRKVDTIAVERALHKYGNRVIALAGSAPAYADGVIDPIPELAQLTEKYGKRAGHPIGLHVDACLGSFVVPFVVPTEEFAFPIDAVTSISVDTHKYGLTSKGSSLLMFRGEEWIQHMFYTTADWQGGIYGTPSRLGSRPGASIATTYATLCSIGHDGYASRARAMVAARKYLQEKIAKDPNLATIQVVGDPKLTVLALKSDSFNIYTLADNMKERGHWVLNKLQYPQRIHFCLTNFQTEKAVLDRFLDHLRHCVAERLANPDEKLTGDAEVYCTAQKIPFPQLVNSLVKEYLLATLRLQPKYAQDIKRSYTGRK